VLLAGSSAAVALPTIREQGLSGPAIAMVIAWIGIADAVTAPLMLRTLTGIGKIPERTGQIRRARSILPCPASP